MKRYFTAIIALGVLVVAMPADALFWRTFTSLTGEVTGSVDNIDCTDLGTGLDDGAGYVTTSAGDVYFYYFDRSATNATSSPDYIRCKNYTTSGVWIEAEPSSGAGVPAQADCSGITSGLCLDTDDGKLYSWDGDSVELVGVLDYQPLDSDLTSIAALTTTSYGRALNELANEAALIALFTTPWTVPLGGSGAATFTVGGILLGSGTGPFTALGVATNGQIPIGDGITDPVLANITETGDALVVTNGPGTIALSAHPYVEALADGEAGVASPGVSLYDSDNAGADKYTASYEANTTTTTDGAEDSDLLMYSMEGGTKTLRMTFDQSDGQWKSNYPIDSVPMYVTTADASVDLDTYSTNAYANTCRLEILLTNASPTLNLWNDSECGTTGRGKRVHILYRGTPGTFTVDADTADTFLMDVAGYTVAAGEAITTSQRGAYIELRGRDGGAYWDVINISPVAHWPDPSP